MMKNEVSSYSIDDLVRDRITCWEGVRNYQARNFMRDEMRLGDLAFFYHSNGKPSGVAGVMRICRTAYPDDTQFDKSSKYFDKRATLTKPIWYRVDVELIKKFPHFIPLSVLRSRDDLADLKCLERGSRLSITPVSAVHFRLIEHLGNVAPQKKLSS